MTRPVTDVPFLLGVDDVLPAADGVGLALAQDDQSALGVRVFQQHLDLLARHDLGWVAELAGIHHALALESHLHDHVVADLADDRALEHAARRMGIHLALEHLFQLLALGLAEELLDLFVQLLFRKPQLADDVSVYHKPTLLRRLGDESTSAPHTRRKALVHHCTLVRGYSTCTRPRNVRTHTGPKLGSDHKYQKPQMIASTLPQDFGPGSKMGVFG